jgi:hypothetical protein
MRLLFYPLHHTSFPKHLEIALALRAKCHCIFLITNPNLHSELTQLLELGFEVWIENISDSSRPTLVSVSTAPQQSGNFETTTSTLLDRGKEVISAKVTRWIARLVPHQLRIYLYSHRLQRQVEKEYEAKLIQTAFLLDKCQPDKIVLCGDRNLQYEPAIIKIGVDRSIPMIVPPVSVFSTPKQLAESRANDSEGAFLVNNSYNCDPRGCFIGNETNGRTISVYFPWVVNALARKQMLSKNPWILGGSENVDMLVSGALVKDLLIEHGVPPARIFVTGDTSYDDLIAAINSIEVTRQEIVRKYQLDSSKKLIAISLPQWWEHKLTDEEFHWSSIEIICAAAARLDSNVLISLHPKMDSAKYELVMDRHGLSIIDEPLSSWLPVCDLLVASQGSSTQLWAMISSIPVLVIDWIGKGDNPYNIIRGKHVVFERDEFERDLKWILNNSAYREQLVREQIDQSRMFLSSDGVTSAKDNVLGHIEKISDI